MIKSQKGFALLLVIGITTIILIMIMTISNSISRKIAVVAELDNYCRADLKVYSAFNEMIFILLTSIYTPTCLQEMVSMGDASAGSPLKKGPAADKMPTPFWNLYGEPINLGPNVQVVLKDTAGMVSPVFPSRILALLLTQAAPENKNMILDGLADWQDKDAFRRINGAEDWDYRTANFPYVPRNSYIQCLSEWRLIKGMNDDIFQRIKSELTYWYNSNINYLTMSPDLLRAVFNEANGEDKLVSQLLALRDAHQLTPTIFSALTGITQGEFSLFSPGAIQMTITAGVGTAQSTIEAVVSKKSTPTRPFSILEWRH